MLEIFAKYFLNALEISFRLVMINTKTKQKRLNLRVLSETLRFAFFFFQIINIGLKIANKI